MIKLENIASKLGVKIDRHKKRSGEVKLIFPEISESVGEFFLWLSTKKALALLLWISQKNNKEV